MSEVDETEADMTQRGGYVSGGYARGGYCSGYASRGSGGYGIGGYANRGSGGYGSGGYAGRGSGGYGSDKSVSSGNANRGSGGYGRGEYGSDKSVSSGNERGGYGSGGYTSGYGSGGYGSNKNGSGGYGSDKNVSGGYGSDKNVSGGYGSDKNVSGGYGSDKNVSGGYARGGYVSGGYGRGGYGRGGYGGYTYDRGGYASDGYRKSGYDRDASLNQGEGHRIGCQQNDELRNEKSLLQNDDNEDQEKEDKEIDVESTMCNEEEEFPNSSDFELNLEDRSGLSYLDEEEDLTVYAYEETITIKERDNSISAVDYLMEKDVVAVHVEVSKDGLQRILCVTEDKSYIFELENNPFLMTFGKVAEFFSWTPEPKGPTKVFHGLDSKTCAVFFDKYDIILDGTKIYDLKIAYDLMKERCLDAHITELNKTGFSPYNCIYNINTVCLTYIKAYQYLSQVQFQKEIKDCKKHLFEMVRAEINSEKLKKAKERKKKEYKAANKERLSHLGRTSKFKKQKRKMDFPVHQLASELKEKEITNEREEKLENIPSKDSTSYQNFTAAKQLPENCNSTINLQAGLAHVSLNNNLQQEFNETRQMAKQCATQKSQEEQCQVIAVVKHESVDFPDGRRYTCRSTIVPDPVSVEGKSTATQTESDKCKDVGVQCEIIDWNKYQKMIELAEVVLR
ncbi:uncharacterized protein LOC134701495 [Mytilus trossulus]|uniref:uncharacterized protein LOC134701495 n=1 Tax=Mytilus trossulus TaxID=6551 RepID=UPI003006824B